MALCNTPQPQSSTGRALSQADLYRKSVRFGRGALAQRNAEHRTGSLAGNGDRAIADRIGSGHNSDINATLLRQTSIARLFASFRVGHPAAEPKLPLRPSATAEAALGSCTSRLAKTNPQIFVFS
jgi:hypothetical protein